MRAMTMSTEKYEGLEVVGYASECGLSVLRGLPITGAVQIKASAHKVHDVPLCRLSDAKRAIAELREVNRIQLEIAEVHGAACVEIRKERDTLRQLVDERDAQIASMRAEVTPFIETHWMPVARQRDKLAGLLREWRGMFDGGLASGQLGVLRGQTDAALDAVSK